MFLTYYKPELTEGESVNETPYEDIANIDPKWERWADQKLRDPGWRNEASMAFKRLIEATKNFNKTFEGRARPREIEPHWTDILCKIEAIEKEIESQGFVRSYSIYTDGSDSEDCAGPVIPPNEVNSLNDQSENTVQEPNVQGIICST